ncbi:hypothetical protein EDD18DRAFT_1087000 [Armillaria luteobubalina]|uniref:Uncharacterized protein n=1 Tax=Armillaria luteobubalina TaxID=153913 RepID=A0AA39TBJ3_9AGAR|nr:hypothetical protein EDD18DRAFT_1087000 [Armillaria luteobubalina]
MRIKDELQHIDKELKSNTPELKKVESAYAKLQGKIANLKSSIDAAEDRIFSSFCQKIKVSHIREYEECQLKVGQEESEAQLWYDSQITCLTHFPSLIFWYAKARFESKALKSACERLQHLEGVISTEGVLEKLKDQKEAAENNISNSEAMMHVS